jgi:hypothetical protein
VSDALQPECDSEDRGRLGSRAYVAWLAVAVALVFSVTVLLISERRSVEDAIAGWGRQMPIIAVLHEDLSEAQGRALAEKIRAAAPGAECTLISPREGRSLLALQEPWLRRLPETMIGDLPPIIEIRHPALFRSSSELDAFLASLQALREVDFVVFNSVGHDRVIEALSVARRHADVLLAVVGCSLVIMLVSFQHQMIRRRGRRALGPAVGLALMSAVVGCAVGGAIVWAVSLWALRAAAQQPLMIHALSAVALAALVVLVEITHAGTAGPKSAAPRTESTRPESEGTPQ